MKDTQAATIAGMFEPTLAEIRTVLPDAVFTVIVRHPRLPNGQVIVGDDGIADAQAALADHEIRTYQTRVLEPAARPLGMVRKRFS